MPHGSGVPTHVLLASPACPGPLDDAVAARGRSVYPLPPALGARAGHPRTAREVGIHVLKFGSSILSSPAAYRSAAEEVRGEVAGGAKAVVVVSAMGATTDSLLASARTVATSPPDSLVGALVATGEEASVALLAIALKAAGVPALGLPGWRLPIHTRGDLRDADPVAVDGQAILNALASHDAVVLPGFVGRDATGSTSLLGRGGSDLTALFLGHVLGATEVRLVKDVDGIYPADPKRFPGMAPLARATWSEARRIGGAVVQGKALAYAERNVLGFRVAAPGGTGTWVGARPSPERPILEAAGERPR